MNPGIILTFYYQVSFWWKENINLLQNLWSVCWITLPFSNWYVLSHFLCLIKFIWHLLFFLYKAIITMVNKDFRLPLWDFTTDESASCGLVGSLLAPPCDCLLGLTLTTLDADDVCVTWRVIDTASLTTTLFDCWLDLTVGEHVVRSSRRCLNAELTTSSRSRPSSPL